MKIYHNPRCSKSRETLQLINDRKAAVTIVEYLKEPPAIEELRDILKKLNMTPEQLVRKQERLYREKYRGRSFSDDEWLTILTENPSLIERPIVVRGDQAIIGRPPEKVKALL